MIQEILASIEKLPTEDLLKLKETLDRLIQKKYETELGRRASRRARVQIPADLEIEREKEFFDMTYKITILEMSVNGLAFKTEAPVVENDILGISFRLPSSGQKKFVDCQALRIQRRTSDECEVAAKAVDRDTVRAYRDMLSRRGR